MAGRFLTTHTGSLARPPDLTAMLLARAERKPVERRAFDDACRRAVADVVRKQCAVGLDVINDGEQSKTGFVQYMRERLAGLDGEPAPRGLSLEAREFPEAPRGYATQTPCTGPLSWRNFGEVERDIENLKAAAVDAAGRKPFMTAVSPGSFVNAHPDRYYGSRDKYLAAVIEIMRREYEAIAAAGFMLQIDSPDLAQRSYNFPDLELQEWLKIVAQYVDALNEAIRIIPKEQVRVHVCWGAGEAPHNHDTELKDIVHLLLNLRVSALSFVAANGRHEHEWRIWEDVGVPPDMTIIPGVLDSTTNIVEHPETVAERLLRFCSVVNCDQIMAGVDCGFGTTIKSTPKVIPSVAWAKLQSLVAGAALASARIWGRSDAASGSCASLADRHRFHSST